MMIQGHFTDAKYVMGDGSCRIQDNKFKNNTLEWKGRKHDGVGRKQEEEKRNKY